MCSKSLPTVRSGAAVEKHFHLEALRQFRTIIPELHESIDIRYGKVDLPKFEIVRQNMQ